MEAAAFSAVLCCWLLWWLCRDCAQCLSVVHTMSRKFILLWIGVHFFLSFLLPPQLGLSWICPPECQACNSDRDHCQHDWWIRSMHILKLSVPRSVVSGVRRRIRGGNITHYVTKMFFVSVSAHWALTFTIPTRFSTGFEPSGTLRLIVSYSEPWSDYKIWLNSNAFTHKQNWHMHGAGLQRLALLTQLHEERS